MSHKSVGSPYTRTFASLCPSQLIRLIALGATLWLLAALLLRFLAPMGVYDGMGRYALYLLIIPGTFPFILLVRYFARLAPDQTGMGVAVVTAAAILLDGISLGWFPQLYGEGVENAANAGAAILWGGGIAITLGVLMNRDRPPHPTRS
jgi:hypothetical protein